MVSNKKIQRTMYVLADFNLKNLAITISLFR